MTDALALPLALVGPKDWHVIQWILNHQTFFEVWMLRWLAVSLIAGAFWFLARGGWREDR